MQPAPLARWLVSDSCDCERCRNDQVVLDVARHRIEAAGVTGYSQHGRGLVSVLVCQDCFRCAADVRYVELAEVSVRGDAEDLSYVQSYDPAREVVVALAHPGGYLIKVYPRSLALTA
jgi:hypothetical protein